MTAAEHPDPVIAAAHKAADAAPPMPESMKRRVAELLRPIELPERKAS